MNKIAPIPSEVLENICRVIADTNTGLTGTEIGRLLSESLITDTDPNITKWRRLFNAFANVQNKQKCSNNILTFIQKAMQPVRYIDNNELFEFRLMELNKRLGFVGLELSKESKYRNVEKVTTIQNVKIDKSNNKNEEYHIAISFAGEDREVAESIASKLKDKKYNVFYDRYEQAILWGKDLYSHLTEIYSKKAQFCLMIISKNYADKQWTNLERMAAQARAFSQSKEYILPLKLDDTVIPGLNETIAYVDYRKVGTDEIVNMIEIKLK